MDLEIYNISLVPIIIFINQLAVHFGLPKKLSPLVCLFFGLLAGILYLSPDNIPRGILMGLFLASSSVGFYSGTKNVVESLRIRKTNRIQKLRK